MASSSPPLSPCAAQDKATSALHWKILPMFSLELKLSCLVALCSSHSVLVLAWTTGIPSCPKSTGKLTPFPTTPLSNPAKQQQISAWEPQDGLGHHQSAAETVMQRTRAAVAFSTQAVRGHKDALGLCMPCARTLGSVPTFSPWTARGLQVCVCSPCSPRCGSGAP